MEKSSLSTPDGEILAIAERLHSAAIHLLRRARTVDEATGLSPPKLSALSVLVFGGTRSLKDLAAAEQVRPPTMTKIVQDLESKGLVKRKSDRTDRRVVLISPTPRAERILRDGRTRRARLLATWLFDLSEHDLHAVAAGVEILERIVRRRWSDVDAR